MTRFDPFAYGQVNLNDGKASSAATPASPDDLLFADGGAEARNGPPADSSWGLLDTDVDSLLPNAKTGSASGLDFGADVLGEAEPAAGPAPAPVRPRPAATPRPAAAPVQPSVRSGPRALEEPRHEVGSRPLAAPTPSDPAKGPTYVARKPSAVGRLGRSGLAATAVPTVLFVGGAATSAWLQVAQQHTMMAVIVGALTIVATGFTRLLLRG